MHEVRPKGEGRRPELIFQVVRSPKTARNCRKKAAKSIRMNIQEGQVPFSQLFLQLGNHKIHGTPNLIIGQVETPTLLRHKAG
jgi:hypothetical protein